MSNLTEHKCAGKCPEFKTEQCNHCLIQQIEKREFELGVAPDDAYVKDSSLLSVEELDFLVGDVVVITSPKFSDDLFTVVHIVSKPCFIHPCAFIEDSRGNPDFFGFPLLRHATTPELKAKKRLDAPVALFVSDTNHVVKGGAV